MNCAEVCRFIYVYLDGEFEPRECAEFEQHVAHCSACRAMLPFEQSFYELLRARMERYEAPARLRDEILAALDREEAAFVGRGRFAREARRFPRARVMVFPALAAAALLTVVLWPRAIPQEDAAPAAAGIPAVAAPLVDAMEQLLAETVAAHEHQAAGDVAGDQESVQDFVRTRATFGATPPFPVNETTRLIGARLTQVGDRAAVLYTYEHNGRRVSALQFQEDTPPDNRALQRAYYTGRTRGYNVAVFRDHERGLSHSIVGDVDEQDLLHLIRPAAMRRASSP